MMKHKTYRIVRPDGPQHGADAVPALKKRAYLQDTTHTPAPPDHFWNSRIGRFMLKMISRLVNTVRLVGRDSHHQNIRTSRKVLRAVRSFSEPGMAARCLAYLRQVEPAVFEEVVLSALEDAGLFVLRSRRYSGDGGIDGAAWLPTWGLCAIQIKRYRSHVCAAHVREFCDAVRRQSYSGGLFVHTGRSGASVYDYLAAGKIYLVSGDRLTRLVLNRVLEYGCLRKTSS